MEIYMVLNIVFGAIVFVGAIGISYQIYQITVIDAKARGLKHPKLWGLFAMNNNNASGLIMYLIGRRNYPILNLSDTERRQMERRKKIAGIGVIFLVVGAIGFILNMIPHLK